MTQTQRENIAKRLKILVELLTQNKFQEVCEKYPSEYNLTAKEILDSIESYGCKLVTPSEEELRNFDAVEIENNFPKLWDIRSALWTIEEGKSDLTIVLDVEETSERDYIIRLRDILVP
jgi:hypothetical protein